MFTRKQFAEAVARIDGLPADAAAKLAASSHLKELDDACPDCQGGQLVCCHAELGGSLDYRDQFLHVCLNAACRFAKYVESVSSVGQESQSDQLCPFCGRDVLGFGKEADRREQTATVHPVFEPSRRKP